MAPIINKDPDFYSILGLTQNATANDIKKSFRIKAKENHPDKGGEETTYNLIRKAYEVLSDNQLRTMYNNTGRTTKTPEEDFLDNFKNKADEEVVSQAVGLPERIVRPQEASHSSGFDEWLRTRDVTKSTITDDTIRDAVGVTKSAYQPTTHACTHPTMKLYRQSISGKDLASASNEKFVSSKREKMTANLEWGEVMVNIQAAPVNPYDIAILRIGEDIMASYHYDDKKSILQSKGEYSAENRVMGSEALGEVVSVGPGVKNLKQSSWVIPLKNDLGTWQTAAIWKERDLLEIPKYILPVEYLAVSKELFLGYYLLQHFGKDLKPGDSFIINAANSLVGQTLIQFAKLLGLRAIGIIRASPQFETIAEYLIELGASRIYADNEGVKKLLQKEGLRLPQIAFDGVMGSSATTRLLHCLQPSSTIVSYGSLSGESLNLPWHLFISQDVTLKSFYLTAWLEKASNQQIFTSSLENLEKLVKTKKLIVNIKNFPLDQYDNAIGEVKKRGRMYKPLLKPYSIQEEATHYVEDLQAMERQEQQDQETVKHLFCKDKDGSTESESVQGERVEEPKSSNLVSICVNDNSAAKTTLIFVHGFGETPEEYEVLFNSICKRDELFKTVRVQLPEGIQNQQIDGEDLPSWTDISYDNLLEKRDTQNLTRPDILALQQMEKSCNELAQFIEEEIYGQKSKNVVLAGSNQGGVVALFSALTKLEVKVSGIICLGFPELPIRVANFLREKSTDSNKNTNIFVLNGSEDCSCGSIHAIKETLKRCDLTAVVADIIPHGTSTVGLPQLHHLSSVIGLLMA